MKIFRRFTSIALGVVTALVLTVPVAQATPPDEDGLHKDWVCKYVGTPRVDERLKNGNDGLVWVDTAATEGTWFNDRHGRSFVLLANAPREPRPDASSCPGGDVVPPQPDDEIFISDEATLTCEYVLTTVSITYTTPYVLIDGVWVADWANVSSDEPIVDVSTLTHEEALAFDNDFEERCGGDDEVVVPPVPEVTTRTVVYDPYVNQPAGELG